MSALPPRRGVLATAVLTLLLLLSGVVGATARAALPGTNGRIAFQGFRSLGSVNPDGGTGER